MLDQQLNRQVTSYIHRCVEQAIDAVNWKGDTPKFWFTIIGKDLIFHMQEPELHMGKDPVVSRVLYRLNHNLEKNFGLEFYAPLLTHYNINEMSYLYDLQDRRDGFDWERALDQVEIFGTVYILCGKWDLIVDKAPDWSKRDELMKSEGDIYGIISFPCVYEVYSKAYNDTPANVWAYIKEHGSMEGMGSNRLILDTATKDFEEHGCSYYSVCRFASPKCKKVLGCIRPAEARRFVKDGIAISNWKLLRQDQLNSELDRYTHM